MLTIRLLQPTSLAGAFTCSNANYTEIWDLGANVVHQACFGAETQPSTWEPAGADGVLIRGQRPARSAQIAGTLPTSYNLTFQTNIARGGSVWAVDAPLQGSAGIWSESLLLSFLFAGEPR